MGNCIRKESPMQWGGEDWGSPARREVLFDDDDDEGSMKREEEKGLLVGGGGDNSNVKGGGFVPSSFTTSTKSATEVKIKITKKQLEELLGGMDVQGLTVQQVLARLMTASDGYESHHHRSWRPALQSIPEVN